MKKNIVLIVILSDINGKNANPTDDSLYIV